MRSPHPVEEDTLELLDLVDADVLHQCMDTAVEQRYLLRKGSYPIKLPSEKCPLKRLYLFEGEQVAWLGNSNLG